MKETEELNTLSVGVFPPRQQTKTFELLGFMLII